MKKVASTSTVWLATASLAWAYGPGEGLDHTPEEHIELEEYEEAIALLQATMANATTL